MSFLADIPEPTRRTDRKLCPGCGAGAATCRGLEWLSDRRCCKACPPAGHDGERDE